TGTGGTPNTPTEHTLAHIFRDVLHIPDDTPLTVDDNFFHLGGHSLSATRLIARVNSAVGSDLTLRDVFESPTIAGLADAADSTGVVRVRVSDMVVPEQVPASYGQQSLWVIDQLGGPKSQYVVPTVLRL
ncbi:phosphopantetheine-binding protein, partial [Rhodococcoides fascians]|uniref:phosphopantetheine-binding protein n=1 Tax=Rhodococcoides fascians TaxID=1828 RepID=UPI0018AFC03E